jgi:hypothetical protein
LNCDKSKIGEITMLVFEIKENAGGLPLQVIIKEERQLLPFLYTPVGYILPLFTQPDQG